MDHLEKARSEVKGLAVLELAFWWLEGWAGQPEHGRLRRHVVEHGTIGGM
jgi:hypothetical protein